jgi:TolB protein
LSFLDIFVTNTSSNISRQLTFYDGADGEPVFSHDGGSVLFTSNRDGDFEIYRMDLDGKELLRLTDNNGPDYSPIVIPGE